MAGLLRGGFATGLLVLCLAGPAEGFGFRWRNAYHSYYAPAYYAPRMSYYPAHYAPQPAYSYPYQYQYQYQYQCPAVMPGGYPSFGSVPYAQPRPAPASTPEPPTDRPGRSPKITESRYAVGNTGADKSAGTSMEYCRVGFWNLTGRDVKLLVDGQAHFLKKDHALTLDLTRQFAWKMDQGELRSERVPADQRSHEILLRAKAGR